MGSNPSYLLKYFLLYYLVKLIKQPITNPEFLQHIFGLFSFSVFLPGKSFKLQPKNANITLYI